MPKGIPLDIALLRDGKNKEVSAHLRELTITHRPIEICDALLEALNHEKLSIGVFQIFLSATKSIECIKACMYQTDSIVARQSAIKQYGKAMADKDRWREAWQSMGSTEGILEYLSTISVDDVKRFCSAVGYCNNSINLIDERAAAVEELIKSMNYVWYTDAKYKSPDKRPLAVYASLLVPACSPDFIEELLDDGGLGPLYERCSKPHLLKNHEKLIRPMTSEVTLNNVYKTIPEDAKYYLVKLTSKVPSKSSDEKYFSASMKFSEKILEQRLGKPDLVWPSHPSETEIYFSLLNRCQKRRLSKERLHSIMELGMRLLEFKSSMKPEFSRKNSDFWFKIVKYWGKWPEHWEDLFLRGLRQGLGGVPTNLCDVFLNIAQAIKATEERSWNLLRLVVLHASEAKIDIDKVDDLVPLGRQQWNLTLFRRLPPNKAIQLLKLNLRGSKYTDFLTRASHDSILATPRIQDQRNLNALLFLTMLQIQSSEVKERDEGFTRASDYCIELKKRSEASKEQQDRATFAKVRGLYAIASGSLELYADHISWLARFIRDPLTLKVVFGKDAIASTEAAELLSGIPEKLNNDTRVSEISLRVSQANAILLKLHEHHRIAKREPSYQEYDWQPMRDVLGNAIIIRIQRARHLQRFLKVSQAELYGQIWTDTFTMFSLIDASSKGQIRGPLSGLMMGLPPKLLAAFTKSILETDDRNRATKAEGKEVESESFITEAFAYDCLLALAAGDNPTIAGDLLVHTIINRPDASSWHRQMLNLGFFKRLPAKNAEKLLLDFSHAIGEKLEEQSYVRIGEATGAPSIVKVTTVKYLAQILQNAQFLSPESSIDVLVELFKVATHPDIRLATLESMLSMLTSLVTTELTSSVTDISEVDNPLIQKILSALDAVIPIVGSINERRPPKEQDWIEAEEDLSKLPDPTNFYQRQLWTSLVQGANNGRILKTYFVQRLLLPSLEISIQEHRRWLALFLKKHQAGFSVDKLPSNVSASMLMIGNLVTHFPSLAPVGLLQAWNNYNKFMLQQPVAVTRFISKLEGDENKRDKADVQQFISVFKVSTSITMRTTHSLIDLIHHTWQPVEHSNPEIINVGQVRGCILEQLRILLANYDKNVTLWHELIGKLRHPTDSDGNFRSWERDCKPLIGYVVRIITEARNPQWLKDPERHPSILPTATKPRLWLLSYASPGLDEKKSDLKATDLGKELVEFIKDLLHDRNNTGNSEKLVNELTSVKEKLNIREDIHVALQVGNFRNIDPLEEIIRVQLALNLLSHGKEAIQKDKGLKTKAAGMIKQWERSLVEDVREIVLNLRVNATHGRLWELVFRKD